MIEQFLQSVADWGTNNPSIECIILVGSYARGNYHANSDIDLCIITPEKDQMLEELSFVALFGEIVKKQIENYGACTSFRVWYKDSKEVEFGLVEPSWIALPLDPGTSHVLRDGYKIILDKMDYFNNIGL